MIFKCNKIYPQQSQLHWPQNCFHDSYKLRINLCNFWSSQDTMAKPALSFTGPLDPQWGFWTVSVTGDDIVYLFQSREVSCMEVQVDDKKIKSPNTSEVIDLNGFSLLFLLWKMQLNLEHNWFISASSVCVWAAWGLSVSGITRLVGRAICRCHDYVA